MSSYWTVDERDWGRLISVVRYAGSRVPYYRDQFKYLGIDTDKMQCEDDLLQIPITEKEHIQQHWRDFISDDYELSDLVIQSTSGSTGIPLKLAKTKAECVVAGRCLLAARIKSGLRMPFRHAAFTATPMIGTIHSFDGNSFRERRGTNEFLYLSCLDPTERVLDEFIQELTEFQPTWLYGYPSLLDYMARFIISTDRIGVLKNFDIIELVSEYAQPAFVNRIEQAFGKRPVSYYGCREIWGIAFECLHGGMHVLNSNVHLEVLAADGSSAAVEEVGEAVITGKNLYSMPFIRYRLGDLLIKKKDMCSCGSAQPLIEIVGGRTVDFIVGHPGKIGSVIFDNIMKNLYLNRHVDIHQYRVVQRSAREFEVDVVANDTWNSDACEFFSSKANSVLGGNCCFSFRLVERIQPHGSGKSKTFLVDLRV